MEFYHWQNDVVVDSVPEKGAHTGKPTGKVQHAGMESKKGMECVKEGKDIRDKLLTTHFC